MKLRLFALVLFFVAVSNVSHGQIGIYATPVFTSVHNTTPDQGVFSFLGPNQTSRVFSGVGFGAYDQFFHRPSVDLGGDFRFTVQRGSNAALNQLLFGARASFHPFTRPIKPYVEVLGGLGSTRSGSNSKFLNRGTFSGSAGIDYSLGKHVDLRVIEIGYQTLQAITTQQITGAPGSPPPSRLLNFSAGIVFVIPSHSAAP